MAQLLPEVARGLLVRGPEALVRVAHAGQLEEGLHDVVQRVGHEVGEIVRGLETGVQIAPEIVGPALVDG